MKYIYFSFLISFLIKIIQTNDLRFVFGMFRHGARAPWKYLDENNTDVFGNSWVGDSQLTEIGLRQHYLIGYKNKEKYFKLLNIDNYNPNEISIFSTETDRTIMSAYSELFGMFPPSTGPKVTTEQILLSDPPIKNFDYSEIKNSLKDDSILQNVNILPVHVFDKSSKYFNLHDIRVCGPVKDFIDANKKSKRFQNFSSKVINNYGDKIIKLTNKTDINFLKDYDNFYYVFDSFMSNYIDGRNLTKFTDEGIDIEKFYELTVEFLFLDQFLINFGDKENYVGRMSFSPIFEYLINLMDSRISFDKNGKDVFNSLNPKMLLYSGHDTNLAAMQSFLKAVFGDKTDFSYTYFASSFYFEFYRDINLNKSENLEDQYFLKILFNEENIFKGPIKFSEFKNTINNRLVSRSEIDTFCKFDTGVSSGKTFYSVICIILFGLIVILMVLIIKKIKNQKENNTNYKEVSV